MDPRSIQKVEQKLYNHLISTGPQSMSLTGALVRKDKLNQKLSVFLNERPHLFRVDSNKIVYAVSPPTRPPTRPPTQPKTQSTTQEYVPIAAQAFFQFSEESNTAQKSNTAQGIVVQADEGNSDNEFELINTHFSDINLREDQVTDRNRNEKLYCPLFTRTVLTSDRDTGSAPSFPMYGLLGTILSGPGVLYERLYLNTNTPLSGLICGVQGSGKSHTLNCMLENYLLPGLGKLPAPPTVLVLHFDSAGGGEGTQPCESAYLGNPIYIGRPAVTKITVLVSPSNYKTMKAVYSHIPNCTVRPLFFSQGDLNVKRMMSLMAVDETEAKPLYMQVLQKLLRDMGDSFDYEVFRKRLDEQQFSPQQKSPLDMRLDLLDSFLVEQVARHLPSSEIPSFAGGLGSLKQIFGPGEVVIADLSDPFIDRAAACSIFDIIVGLLCEVTKTSGKVVVLDEAHKVRDAQ
ncbi:hypothetical protein BC937DRAFT_87040 [Endogone sp. FLAS-F59071]|nr:hypothetical protein BC937DRAFT_87040 [Endogone sp. FLAS-F59071]|eukprot:RUS22770.1 hypothetical protein BC937DRAFT_87040 [Endogone sp. FLAS-F59071]